MNRIMTVAPVRCAGNGSVRFGYGCYVADGEAAGQEVAHVHIHLIPRRAGDGFGFRFPPGYGTQPARAALEATAGEIRAGMSPRAGF